MQVYLGSDHSGFDLKKEIKDFLVEKFNDLDKEEFKVLDLGVFTNDATEYLDIEREVCEKVIENTAALGVVFSANGNETCSLANKTKGIKAILVDQGRFDETVRPAPNVLCFPAHLVDVELVKKTIGNFIDAQMGQK